MYMYMSLTIMVKVPHVTAVCEWQCLSNIAEIKLKEAAMNNQNSLVFATSFNWTVQGQPPVYGVS